METETDSTGRSGDTTDRSIDIKPGIRPLELEEYDMTKERKMLIFNHYDYVEPYMELKEKPSVRHGTNNDVVVLEKTFKDLKFHVETFHDKDHDVILDKVENLCSQDHRNTSCVCVCVLTHGYYGGILYAHDKIYNLSELINLLQNAPGLVGKPKLVIVQACRGGFLDDGKYAVDGPGRPTWLPTHADTLILRSTVEAFVSFRDVSLEGKRSDDEGSWLIQDLCRVVKAKHRVFDVLQMTTLVTSLVAQRVSYSDQQPEIDKKKQTPETRSTLTKILRF